MKGGSDAAVMLSRVSPPLSSVTPPITTLPQPQPNPAPTGKQRRMFTVELRPGETTVVSWKKLIKESGSGNGEDPATMERKPALEAGPVAEDGYFKVDKLSTKHNGYFINRGKLEWNESNPSPKLETKKRRRKDSAEIPNEIDHKHSKRGNTKMKAAARSVLLVAKSLNPGKVVTSFGEHHQEEKHLKIKPTAPVIYKKHSADFAIDLDVPPSTRIPDRDLSSVKLEPKDVGKNKSLSSKGLYKSICTRESLDAIYQTSQEKAVVSQAEPQPKKLFSCETDLEQLPKIRCKDRYGTCEYPQISSSMTSYPAQTIQTLSNRVSEVTVRPKGTTLERAIQELEKIVALSRPPNPAVKEVDPTVQGTKRRLPQEVKQKLAKVARLSASQGKITEEELIDRLMVFLGHLVQRKTLKRNMREMVELGLSAKQQKADKLQQIKKEAHEMIKSRASVFKPKGRDQLNDSADDFQNVISTDERRALTGRYSMDVALEEKLCDLYDLYVEFAELWPAGYMDNLGIKDAIYRAKKRRQHKLQVRNKERIERTKLAAEVKLQEPTLIAQPQAGQERHMVPTFQVPRPQDKPISNLSPSIQNKLNDPTPSQRDRYGSKHHEKARRISRDIISDVGSKIISVDMRKKMRSSEIEGDCHAHPQKMQARPGKVKHNFYRPNNDTSLSLQQSKLSIQMPASPTSVQPS